MRSVSWKGEDVSGSNGSGNQASVRVAIPLDEPSPEAALDEVVMLVRHLGAAVKRIDRTAERRAIVLQLPVRRPGREREAVQL